MNTICMPQRETRRKLGERVWRRAANCPPHVTAKVLKCADHRKHSLGIIEVLNLDATSKSSLVS